MNFLTSIGFSGIVFLFLVGMGFFFMLARFYRKVDQGQAMVRNGWGGTRVSFSGLFVVPIVHKVELIDISVKRITIDRSGSEGLICRDNMRADIKVVFFVRVNKTDDDVLRVAQFIGCERASDHKSLQQLFEAKFSEALKTVGKQFEFVGLYTSREQFKEEILKIIGTDLNGFVMDDAAIDFLEQTPLTMLDPDNILDSQGIKKITELTSTEKIAANQIYRDREKTITKQDVEAKEAVLELQRQMSEAESRQKREVESIQAREEAETIKIQQEEFLKSESARIASEEAIQVAEENKNRQILVAAKNRERTEAIENEKLQQDQELQATERERVVSLSRIEKDKALEIERKNIQDVIRDRVRVEKSVVEEQEKIKDTQALAAAERERQVTVIQAEKAADEDRILTVKAAEAGRKVAELKAEEQMTVSVKEAEAKRQASEFASEQSDIEAEAYHRRSLKEAEAQKALADAEAVQLAAAGMSEVRVTEARSSAIEKEGTAKARVQSLMYQSEARGIEQKAQAMKTLDGVGREHEEYKLRLEMDKAIALAEIDTRRNVAAHQAEIMAQALKSAKVDIVGGDTTFFDRIVGAVTAGKAVDRYIGNSKTLSDVKETFFNSDPAYFQQQLKSFFKQFGLSAEDVKNLSVSAAIGQLMGLADTDEDRSALTSLLALAERSGLADRVIGKDS